MKCKVITIGHDYGSGGRDIGRKLAEKLNYKYKCQYNFVQK